LSSSPSTTARLFGGSIATPNAASASPAVLAWRYPIAISLRRSAASHTTPKAWAPAFTYSLAGFRWIS